MRRTAALEARITERYDAVPAYVKEDIVEACVWARDVLTRHEGGGHQFQIVADHDGSFCCAFAKPSWGGEHPGGWMPTVEEAIVMSVCEYLCGA